jgi:hypothetical protein
MEIWLSELLKRRASSIRSCDAKTGGLPMFEQKIPVFLFTGRG